MRTAELLFKPWTQTVWPLPVFHPSPHNVTTRALAIAVAHKVTKGEASL